jgi:hypothetical protein
VTDRLPILIAAVALFLCSSSAIQAADDTRLDAYAGFSVVNGAGLVQPGWNAATTIFLNRHIGIKFDCAGSYNSGTGNLGSLGIISLSPGGTTTTRLGTTHHQYTYMAGPQFRFKAGHNIEPFGHVLFGATRERYRRPDVTFTVPILGTPLISNPGLNINDMAIAAAIGGGMDYHFSRHFSWRLISLDYQMDNAFGSTTNRLRVSTGLVYGLGTAK